jgi:anti-sigma factor RsiW
LLTCKEFLQELADYLDTTLDAELCRQLEAHISNCPTCYVILDTTQRTIKLYKGMQPQEVPEVVHVRLMAALERKMGRKPGASA